MLVHQFDPKTLSFLVVDLGCSFHAIVGQTMNSMLWMLGTIWSGNQMEYLILLRGGERLLAEIGAFLLLALGALLLKWGVLGQASMTLQGKSVTFKLINASPGIFFALFGTVLLAYTLTQGFTVKEESGSNDTRSAEEITYSREQSDAIRTFVVNCSRIDSNADSAATKTELQNIKEEALRLSASMDKGAK
jgi:hypothetical protein